MALMVSACGSHEVDSLEKWCEPTMGIDRAKKYNPWGLPFFVFSIREEAIRDDVANVLDREAVRIYFDKNEIEENEFTDILGNVNKIPRMVWRDGLELHLFNLKPFVQDGKEFIDFWKQKLGEAKEYTHENPKPQCLFMAVADLFDSLNIHKRHFQKKKGNGEEEHEEEKTTIEDKITVIPTERLERLKAIKKIFKE